MRAPLPVSLVTSTATRIDRPPSCSKVHLVMLRRLCTLMLMLACALAPVRFAFAVETTAEHCCCGKACACTPSNTCAPLPGSPTPAPQPTAATAVEERAAATKPTVRVARLVFAHFVSLSDRDATRSIRIDPDGHPPAASVALFQAHCSLLI
jgi:hypothetical protein